MSRLPAKRGPAPAPSRAAGYSGTPLAQKLGIGPGCVVHAIDAPAEYRALLGPLDASVKFVSASDSSTDLVHLFSVRRERLALLLPDLRARLSPQAVVWVSWPKKAAKVPSDVGEDTIRELALPIGFVDVKVCAVSDVWSGLKLVVRKELR